MAHIESEHTHAPAFWNKQAEDCLEERALARTVGPEQTHRPAGKHDADVAQRRVLAVADADALEIDNGGHYRAHTFGFVGSFKTWECVIGFRAGPAHPPVRAAIRSHWWRAHREGGRAAT